jgi:CRP-like cAMP-binding protein
MRQFSDFILSKVSIEETDLSVILSKFKRKIVSKGHFVLKKKQTANQYYFVVRGGLRFSFGDLESKNTSWVVFQNEFFAEMSSLISHNPTRFNIEAIEETELLYIEKLEMEKLYEQFPKWQEFGRKILEEMSVGMIEQIVSFQTQTAEERYLNFLKTPELLQKLPVKHLASLLGITPNALSRIRKNIR